jgi:hypothetical protein
LDWKNRYEQTGEGLTRVRRQEILALPTSNEGSTLPGTAACPLTGRSGLPGILPAPEGDGSLGSNRKGRYDSMTYSKDPGFLIEDGKQKLSKIGHLKIKMHRQAAGQEKPLR